MRELNVTPAQLKGMILAFVSPKVKITEGIYPILRADCVPAETKNGSDFNKHITKGNKWSGESVVKLLENHTLLFKGSIYSRVVGEGKESDSVGQAL